MCKTFDKQLAVEQKYCACSYFLLLLFAICINAKRIIGWAWREFREIFREIWGGFQENEINEINAKFGGVPREIFFALLSD
jgi:hypothetical protein